MLCCPRVGGVESIIVWGAACTDQPGSTPGRNSNTYGHVALGECRALSTLDESLGGFESLHGRQISRSGYIRLQLGVTAQINDVSYVP